MKVLDLACQHGHGFEGWFGSEEDFQSQLARGLVQCPICDDAKITKKLSAPRLNLRGAKEAAEDAAEAADVKQLVATNSIAPRADSMPASEQKATEASPHASEPEHPLHTLMRNPEFQAAYMQMAKEVLAKTEDVGTEFANEARKIHYGEAKERGIRGQVSRDETLELLDEGIEVMPLPLPKALKGTLQ
ncbi:MAG: DUF1178 family protein [Burkholderiales bacterium]|nr:MAG: DUF1178 family protein [Burkholderiales bacterium]